MWDAVGIATGVFVKGDSPIFVGILLAPELPLEEPFFLAFLSYLGRRAVERGRSGCWPGGGPGPAVSTS